MKRIPLLALLLVIASAGCRTSGERGGANNNDSPAAGLPASVSSTETPRGAEASNTPKIFAKTDFSKSRVSPEMKYDGQITTGAAWSDSNGENILIVTEKKITRGQDNSVHQIFGYLYVVSGGTTRLLWKIQDSAENYCDAGKGLTSPIDVRDLDGDGVAENMFVYNISGGCDVSPIPYKLLMHSGEKKLAIRGTNSVEVPDYRQKGEKNFDGFESTPAEFRKAASDFWDRHVAPLRAN